MTLESCLIIVNNVYLLNVNGSNRVSIYMEQLMEPKHACSRIIIAVVLFSFALCCYPLAASAEMKVLDDSTLGAIYAEGFSSDITGFSDFSITQDASDPNIAYANISLSILSSSYIEIDSLKLGYHDEYDYKTPTPSFMWDQDWTNVIIGGDFEDPNKDFIAKNFYLEAEFENINNNTSRKLLSITLGADYVGGTITADFNSFSGTIDDSNDNTPEYNGHGLNLGTKTITCDPDNDGADSHFSMKISIDGYDKGYWMTFTEATVTP